ncbi:MAG TPA: LamG domain-containing protein, partial [Verrucomicrobiae bacterium]|nr:LamG domain-containing protein [Verrucomicrobiae bacterium]
MKSHTPIIFPRSGPDRAALTKVMALTLGLLCLPVLLQAQTLKNEWSFNESGGTTAFDSISSSNITLVGGASLGGGALTLPGGTGNYASLPDGILSTLTNSMTIETWFTDTGGQMWSRIWSFGGSTTTVTPNNANYIDLMPQAGNANGINGGFWAEFNHGAGAKDAADPIPANSSADRSPIKAGVAEYATLTYDAPSQTARLYLNGVQVGQASVAFKPSDLGFTRYNTIGLDQYNDSPFNGIIDEMRIWNGAVSQRYISASSAMGPG